ncbi:MAG TPA: lysophospholipid acyltransferase family protein [Bacteroidia bacterium]|nr:lysophospholipid acyltransferase family protein [Bacteroidia bacterium]
MIFIRLLRFLYGILAAICFSVSLLIVVPCFFFVFSFYPDEKAPHIAHRNISRRWAKLFYILLFIRVKIKGEEFIDGKKMYVFVANHVSQLDVPAYAIACKNTIRFLAKAELTRIPLMGYIIRKLYLSVDRSDKEARYKSMQNMRKSLEEGISVFICPEGTRNRTSEPLLDFKDGAFRLAIEAQVPLAVLTVIDSQKLLSPLRPVELAPGTIHAIWDKPIDTTGMTEADLPALKEKARALMLAHLKRQ